MKIAGLLTLIPTFIALYLVIYTSMPLLEYTGSLMDDFKKTNEQVKDGNVTAISDFTKNRLYELRDILIDELKGSPRDIILNILLKHWKGHNEKLD